MAQTAGVQSGSFQPDSDIHVTYDDQQKINKFARLNAKLDDMNEELKQKETELENLKFAEDELIPGDDPIPVMFGEGFVISDYDECEQILASAKGTVKEDIEKLKQDCEKIKSNMSELKVQLYAKFGNNINLEPDDN